MIILSEIALPAALKIGMCAVTSLELRAGIWC